MIFLHDIQHEKNKNSLKKLHYKWKNFYRIIEAIVNKNTYFLNELNGADLKDTFADNRFKKFHSRSISDAEEISLDSIEKSEIVENPETAEKSVDANCLSDFRKSLISSNWFFAVIVPFSFQ